MPSNKKKENIPLVAIQDVSKKYGTVSVLEDISFDVKQGDIVAIIGPNGSGKTTLVRIMLGVEEATTGVVTIRGKHPAEAKRMIGYVPQRFHVDRTLPMTVQEFIDLVQCSEEKHCSAAYAKHVIRDVGIKDLLQKKVGTLSGGQLQRVLIARALMHERPLLILDEPAAGIDIEGEKALYELLSKINKHHDVTIVTISHELEFVTEHATKVLCLNKRILCQGVPEKTLTAKNIEKLFGKHKSPYHHHAL